MSALVFSITIFPAGTNSGGDAIITLINDWNVLANQANSVPLPGDLTPCKSSFSDDGEYRRLSGFKYSGVVPGPYPDPADRHYDMVRVAVANLTDFVQRGMSHLYPPKFVFYRAVS